MIYVISDIHGCFEEFKELLEEIRFSDKDEMYILGNIVDYGPQPMELIQDLMMRDNVYPVAGNHDYMALTVLSKVQQKLKDPDHAEPMGKADVKLYQAWTADGGDVTAKEFLKIKDEELRDDILDYLSEAAVYYEAQAGGKHFIMTHGDLPDRQKHPDLSDYEVTDTAFRGADYNKQYFKKEYLVTGHTPTKKIRTDGKDLVYEGHHHVAINCDLINGGKLAAYCLDTGETIYVSGERD